MTRQSLLAGFAKLIDLWPLRPHSRSARREASSPQLADSLERAADINCAAILLSAARLNLADLGFVGEVRVSEIRSKLLQKSRTAPPKIPRGLRGLHRDRAVLARDRIIAANRHAAELATTPSI